MLSIVLYIIRPLDYFLLDVKENQNMTLYFDSYVITIL